jgi:hypothetical protein
MLRLDVRRLKIAVVVLLALLTAGQLALHHHSLAPENGTATLLCGVCAFRVDHVAPALPPAIILAVAAFLAPSVRRAASSAVPLTIATRGPPTA